MNNADVNYYNTFFNTSSNYYESINLDQVIPTPRIGSAQFQLHINARNLSKNNYTITTELATLSNNPSIIAVTETWALTDNDCFPMSGYIVTYQRRGKGSWEEV